MYLTSMENAVSLLAISIFLMFSMLQNSTAFLITLLGTSLTPIKLSKENKQALVSSCMSSYLIRRKSSNIP